MMRLLPGLACAAAILLSGCAARPAAEEPVYKVGFVVSLSGPNNSFADGPVQGIAVAVDEVNAKNLAGRPVKIFTADDASDPKTATEVCTRLILQEHVDAIIGFEPTPARVACDQLAQQAGIPYLASNGNPGDACAANTFTLGPATNQMMNPLVDYLLSQGVRRYYLLGSDYSTPKASLAMAGEYLASRGGTVVGTSFVPTGTTDFSGEFAKMSAANPDAVLLSVVGSDGVTFHKQFANDPRMARIKRADPLMFEPVAKLLSRSAQGVFANSTYFSSLDTPESRQFRDLIQKKYGDKASPDANGVMSYNALQFLAAAVRTAGSTGGAAVITALNGSSVVGPAGKTTLVGHYSSMSTFVGRSDAAGAIEVVRKGDPITPLVKCAQ